MLLLFACTASPVDSPEETSPDSDGLALDDSSPPVARADLVINEFMAWNTDSLRLEDDSSPDWIELYNRGEEAVDLAGWWLSDSSEEPYRHALPPDLGPIEPGGFVLLYVDASEAAGHVDFQLSKDGDEILLSAPSGVAEDWIAFEAQAQDIAAARSPDGEETWIFVPGGTPGASNGQR